MRVLVTDAEYADLDLEREVLAAAGHELVVASCRTAAEVAAAAAGADALLVQYAPVTAEVLDAAPSVRLVSRYGVGVDSVDLDAARERGVWVCNVPDYGTETVALHAVAMLLALLRNLGGHDRAVRSGAWDYKLGGRLRRPGELVLGVVGLGRIGRTVAERAGPWFGRCVGADPLLPQAAWPAGVERREVAEVFAEADAVTLHLPLSERTRALVDEELLAGMRPGAYLVNTARGGLVDTAALLRALESGRLAGAALDVLPAEPPDAGEALLRHERVLLSPHVAWYSEESERELRLKAAGNVVEWARSGTPPYVVVPGRS
ncbi:C-terminal binding protein [Kineococcus sp. NUM-3379]